MSAYETFMVIINFASLLGSVVTVVLTFLTFIFTFKKKDTHPVYTRAEKCPSEKMDPQEG
ncbi:Toxic peptide TxpA [Bacillus spizizenii]|uniref:Toxic peptide TxpA n=1 Tax=Bacillus sp. FSL R5-0603 TaxID=2975307 RepID=UPI002280288F|nr:Toxic peptide TxpA [Bacillus spizizenii]